MSVPQESKQELKLDNVPIRAEYIWIGGNGNLRGKTRTLPKLPSSPEELPIWNYDGSSTNQAPGNDSEVLIRPVKFVKDPFRGGDNILVLCETLEPVEEKPIPTNTRAAANEVFNNPKVAAEEPWYGIEQEYTLFKSDGRTPLGWPENGFPAPQGPYYCSVGTQNNYGRSIAEAHYRCCLYAGITISGINAEVMCGQWEYQIGPVQGIDAGDQMWLARYLMERVCEKFNVVVSIEPKPIMGDWNGAGAHTNFSTKSMREDGGYKHIIAGIQKLGAKHSEHMKLYGLGNDKRMTGKHESSSFDEFSYGVANRGASVRIPRTSLKDQKGYFEDRRPAANMDPYIVTKCIAETVIL